MPVIPAGKGEAGRWEGIRTLALLASAGTALVVGIAAGAGFIAGHFATKDDMKAVKQLQSDFSVCIEQYANPKVNHILHSLYVYSQYLNEKSNILSLREDPGLWWLKKKQGQASNGEQGQKSTEDNASGSQDDISKKMKTNSIENE